MPHSVDLDGMLLLLCFMLFLCMVTVVTIHMSCLWSHSLLKDTHCSNLLWLVLVCSSGWCTDVNLSHEKEGWVEGCVTIVTPLTLCPVVCQPACVSVRMYCCFTLCCLRLGGDYNSQQAALSDCCLLLLLLLLSCQDTQLS